MLLVAGDGGRRLRQAVAVGDADARRVEKLLDLPGERGAGARQEPDAPPDDPLQLPEDEGFGRKPLQPQAGRQRALLLPVKAGVFSNAERPAEELFPPRFVGLQLFEDRGVDLFVEAWNGAHDRRSRLAQALDDLSRVACVDVGHAVADHVEAPGALEDVGQWKKAQRHVPFAHPEALVMGEEGVMEVGVVKHHALGLPRGARGVDERGQVLRGGAGEPCVENVSLPRRAPLLKKVPPEHAPRVAAQVRPLVEHDDYGRRQAGLRDARDAVVLGLAAREEDPDGGIADDVAGLARRARRVDGHGDAPDAQDREVGDRPLRAVVRVDAHHFPLAHAQFQEGLCRVPDEFPEAAVGDVAPAVA